MWRAKQWCVVSEETEWSLVRVSRIRKLPHGELHGQPRGQSRRHGEGRERWDRLGRPKAFSAGYLVIVHETWDGNGRRQPFQH